MDPVQLFEPASCTYTYRLFDEASREALIIDPTDVQIERDLSEVRTGGLKLVWTVETHAHADHITSAGLLAELAGAGTAAPAGCGIATAAVQLKEGDTLRFGGEHIRALHTLGHTAGSMCYLWRNHVFTGDTLLIDGCGRADFQAGNAEALYHSITKVLFALPDETMVWPGHDCHGRTNSTIGAEKAGNARIAGKTLAEFVGIMNALHLPPPERIDETLPANLTSGLRHDAGGGPLQSARPASGYAGDVSPQLAYKWWRDGVAMLIDVRTDAEHEWVGFIPDAIPLVWNPMAGAAADRAFDEGLRAAVPTCRKAVLLCRSGVRSIAAAKRATQLGLEAYNVLEGFEGVPDEHAHRGRKGGWRHHGLPWRQR